MNLIIYITDEANEDAIAIAERLAEQSSLNTSDRFLSATTRAYRQLSEMPGMGAARDYGTEFPNLRMWPVPKFANYLIFYRATEIELRILRVLHGSQNIEQLFSDTDEDEPE